MSGWYAAHVTLVHATLINVLLALSFQVALRSGIFSFASVGFYGIGGYLAAIIAVEQRWNGIVLIVLAAAAGVVGGGVLALVFRRLRGLYLGMVTLAFDLILAVVAINGGELTGGATGRFGVPIMLGTGELLAIAGVAVLAVSQLERRGLGRAFEALRLNEELGVSLGLDHRRFQAFVFSLSAALGAVAGASYVLVFTTIGPETAGFHLVVVGLTMAVIGGTSSWSGAVIGALLITWAPQWLEVVGLWRNLAYGVAVILVVVFAPEGVIGVIRNGVRRLRSVLPSGQNISVHELAEAE